jgi:TatD DNase family protein
MLIDSHCHLDRLDLTPYLAPVPHRGKPNEPQFVCDVAAFVAQLRDESLDALWQSTTDNFHRFFPLAG